MDIMCFQDTNISHDSDSHVFLWLTATASETHHLFVNWLNSSGHNSSKLPAPHKTVHIKWVAPNSLNKAVSLGRFWYQYFGVDSIRLYWLWASFGASFQFKLQHLCLWNHFGWRQLAHLKQAPENKRKLQERVFQSPKRRDPIHEKKFCLIYFYLPCLELQKTQHAAKV